MVAIVVRNVLPVRALCEATGDLARSPVVDAAPASFGDDVRAVLGEAVDAEAPAARRRETPPLLS
ncbi:MAG: hypothetical protein ACRCYU_06870 [Nocardioides sp.]